MSSLEELRAVYVVSPPLDNSTLNMLFANAWPNHQETDFQPILQRSLAYICAFHQNELVGFVNLAWDGGRHVFILDTTVHARWQRQGIGRELLTHAKTVAQHHGVEWLHVDYEPHLEAFYQSCGFRPTMAGLIAIDASPT